MQLKRKHLEPLKRPEAIRSTINPSHSMNTIEPKAAQSAALTEQALFARLQRRLRAQGLLLRRCREDSRDFHNLGRFYAVDADLNCVHSTHIDLADWLANLKDEAAQEVA